MAITQKDEHGEEWRLGIELSDDHAHEPAEKPVEAERNQSHERLERPVHVVTAEHLGWAAIAGYAAITRLVALGARPLDGVEAGHALHAFDLANTGSRLAAGFEPACGGWVHLLTAGLFAIGGANDYTARLGFALGGLLMVAMAFELRHYIGRAGGLALGAMIALSPSVTHYSRASATVTIAMALALVTIAMFRALQAHPGPRRAAALGVFTGLTIAADPTGLASAAIIVAALIPIGLWDAITGKNVFLATRVWLDRYSGLLVTAIVTTAVVWAVSQMMLPGGLSAAGITGKWPSALIAGGGGFMAGWRFYLPVLTLYEFSIALSGVLGAAAILTLTVRSRFATWALIWAVLSIAYFCGWAPRETESIVAMLIPVALVGAIGCNWLHHSDAWRTMRIPLAALGVLTLYIGTVANFLGDVPDASEAPWARHANLFWGASATTEQARLYSQQAAGGLAPVNATVSFEDEIGASIRWYLRKLRPIANGDAATVIASRGATPTNGVAIAATYHFDYTEGWLPNFAQAEAADVIRFLSSGRTWGPVVSADATITVRKSAASAPTVILTPNG